MTRGRHRRGAAIVAVVAALVLAQMLVLAMVSGVARERGLTASAAAGARALYAAHAGIAMALREIDLDDDIDGDGTIGSISDDANDANDPAIGPARVRVERDDSGPSTILRAIARESDTRRTIERTIN